MKLRDWRLMPRDGVDYQTPVAVCLKGPALELDFTPIKGVFRRWGGRPHSDKGIWFDMTTKAAKQLEVRIIGTHVVVYVATGVDAVPDWRPRGRFGFMPFTKDTPLQLMHHGGRAAAYVVRKDCFAKIVGQGERDLKLIFKNGNISLA